MIISANLSSQISSDTVRAKPALLSESLARISSAATPAGAGADAAGTAEGAALTPQLQGMDQVVHQLGNAVSFTQTQENYLKRIGRALDRMGELASRAQDPAVSEADRTRYQDEFAKLSGFISGAAGKDFNGVSLFSGTALQVNLKSEGNPLTLPGVDLSADAYADALNSGLASAFDAENAADKVKLALTQLGQDRATIESNESALHSAANQVMVTRENLTAAAARIQNPGAAEASTEFARQNIAAGSDAALIAQANAMPQSALRLLP